MGHAEARPKYHALTISCVITFIMLLWSIHYLDGPTGSQLVSKLVWPLTRLMGFITLGLFIGRFIETSGWTNRLAMVARPLFHFGKLGNHCGAAFTTAFLSGVSANAMLLDYYKEGLISRRQLFLTNFVNQLPAYFLHLPTTFFIVIPLTGTAGLLYFILTFAAALVRTAGFLIFGHFFPTTNDDNPLTDTGPSSPSKKGKRSGFWNSILKRLPARIIAIAVYVLPIYTLVFILNTAGLFEIARKWMAGFVVTSFIPMEGLSVVILSFAAEFTSGFAAAGALMDAGVLTVKQTVVALLLGNVIAFPIRALRHQLPRYIGIFSPKMGTQLLLLGQSFRVGSLILVGLFYIIFF